MGSLLVGQSGGPTSVINASVVGIFKEGLKHPEIKHLYGARFGIDGILNQNFIEINNLNQDILDTWLTTPSAILGSVRYKLDENNVDIFEQIKNVFIKYDITYFFYIGGNDSMDTCNKIDKYFKSINFKCSVIGIPKTIDNDLIITDHCPGYGSAAKYVATTIAEIYHDTNAYKEGRVTIIEIMGRDAGWLTAATSLASINNEGPDLIYLPENPFIISDFLEKVKQIYIKNKKVLICVSEGIKDEKQKYILRQRDFNNNDDFGHLQLGGVSLILAELVNKNLGYPVRAIELNLSQRCAAHLSSKTDVLEAFKCGSFGVKYALKNETGKMVCIKRESNNPYKISYHLESLDNIATFVKPFPTDWIIDGSNISSDFITYALPLIKGESRPKFKNGLPVYGVLEKK